MIVRHVSCTIDVARAASGSEERQESFRAKRSPAAANGRRIRTDFLRTKTFRYGFWRLPCLDGKVEGSWAGQMETRRWFSGKWKRFIVDGIGRGMRAHALVKGYRAFTAWRPRTHSLPDQILELGSIQKAYSSMSNVSFLYLICVLCTWLYLFSSQVKYLWVVRTGVTPWPSLTATPIDFPFQRPSGGFQGRHDSRHWTFVVEQSALVPPTKNIPVARATRRAIKIMTIVREGLCFANRYDKSHHDVTWIYFYM